MLLGERSVLRIEENEPAHVGGRQGASEADSVSNKRRELTP